MEKDFYKYFLLMVSFDSRPKTNLLMDTIIVREAWRLSNLYGMIQYLGCITIRWPPIQMILGI